MGSTTTNSLRACSPTSESLPPALSAIMPLPTMDSKIARLHASLDGARVAASTAPSQHRTTLQHALDSQPALPSRAWRPPVHATLTTRLLSLTLRPLVRSRTSAARLPLV